MLVAAALAGSGSAAWAAAPVIHVVPPGHAMPGALGLYVPGAGGTVSRADAIASLERGKVESTLLGGRPSGEVEARLDFAPRSASPPAVYVQLPPRGTHPNAHRYLVSVDAPGFDGILTSGSTRIDGLVTIPDITQAAVALASSGKTDIHTVAGTRADLRALDERLTRVHHDRGWTAALVAIALAALAVLWPRAGVLFGAAAVVVALWLSWTGTTRLWEVLLWMTAGSVAVAYLASLRRRAIPWLVAAFFLAFLLVLVISPETHALAVLGARPDGGGRFYGIGNQVETLVLPAAIAGVAVGGLPWLAPIAALALVTVGWSKAGADGGGLVVFAAAFAVLLLRLSPGPVTWRRAVLAGAGVVAVGLALVGIDAALGGSSHVTHAVGGGPGTLFGDLGHRLHLSWAIVTKAWYKAALFLVSLAALVWIATRRPRRAAVDAMLVALAVSLVVNDTPVDVIGLGALGCIALLRFEPVDSRRMRRGALTAVCAAAAAFVLAGCGSEGVKQAAPKTVIGTVQQEAPGKAIFANQGCGACHTYAPAGPDAKGNIGPDLDKLATYAKQAKQPLPQFAHDSIVDPNKYVQPGYPKNVMPKSYGSLPATDLKDLVDFLTKPQG